ncbi:DUF397 domain-containing protein [Streptomyces sp. NPDC003781]|uniref:DUF397 domain-containing protein n=1 Tax=Streptomyces sp. NPDC003781 TaxID=3364686 RepID=UPI00367A23B6
MRSLTTRVRSADRDNVGEVRARRVTRDLSTARWRKSSYSDGQQGGACVLVCDDVPSTVPVRDSKSLAGPGGDAERGHLAALRRWCQARIPVGTATQNRLW